MTDFARVRADEKQSNEDKPAHSGIPVSFPRGKVRGSELESCRVVVGSVAVVFLPSDLDVSPRISPHNPPPRMERDLLSCKHIGSSIENGLTKSIKADIIPGIGGW